MPVEYLTVNHLSTKELIRVFSKIEIHPDLQHNGTPCWIWCANRDKDGYGVISYRRKNRRAHRFLYSWLLRPLQEGREEGEIDHLCRRQSCCSPLHVEYTSAQINVLRSESPAAQNARKLFCVRGHKLEGTNVKIIDHRRQCHQCIIIRKKEWRSRDGNRERELRSPARKQWVRQWCAKNREAINTRARINYHLRMAKKKAA